MIERYIVERTFEYDESGRVTRETITTTEEQDDNYYGGWWQQWRTPPEITCLSDSDLMRIGDGQET